MKKILTLLTCIPLMGYSQMTPCENGLAGVFPCEGWDLVAQLTLPQLGATTNGNDCWGWTDPVTGAEYALMGVDNGTVFVDLCDAVNPVIIGTLPTHTVSSLWRDIKVYQDHAFIVSEAGGHGMQVFDLNQLREVTNPPVTFSNTAHYNAFGNSHNIAINEATGYAYPVGTGIFSGGLVFIDISDPSNPVAAGGYAEDGYTHDTQTVVYNGPDMDWQGKEVSFACNEDTFTIIDLDDKNDPSEISRTGYQAVGYSHQGWLSEDHRFFFLGDEADENNGIGNTRTVVWDIADLDNPVVVEYHSGTTAAIDHNMYVKDGLVYQANYSAGLRVQSFNPLGNPFLSEVGYFDVYPESDQATFIGSWSVYPYYESGLVIISSMDRGLFVVKPSSVDLSVCTPNALTENELDLAISIYPNPALDMLSISLDKDLTGRLTIRDALGRVVKEASLNGQRVLDLDIKAFKVGFYFITVQNNQGILTKTFSKY